MDVELAREVVVATPPRRLRLEELLSELGAGDDRPGDRNESLTVGDLVEKAAEGGFGFLIAIMVLIAIPFFGFSTPFGLVIALMGLQMLFGRTQPWLPKRARRRALKMSMLDRIATILARRTRWLVKATRRRWEMWIHPRVVGFAVTLLALGLALPIPIPGSNWIFLIPLFVYCVGILERDGLWIILGHIGLLANIALMFLMWNVVSMVLERVWSWIT